MDPYSFRLINYILCLLIFDNRFLSDILLINELYTHSPFFSKIWKSHVLKVLKACEVMFCILIINWEIVFKADFEVFKYYYIDVWIFIGNMLLISILYCFNFYQLYFTLLVGSGNVDCIPNIYLSLNACKLKYR